MLARRSGYRAWTSSRTVGSHRGLRREASGQVGTQVIGGSRGQVPSAGETRAECPVCPHAQFSLLSEVRGTISPQDLDRFDHLVLRREIESMKARQPPGPGAGDTYSTVSYSDTGSSTGSHGTSTTVSSARVSCPGPGPGPGSRASKGGAPRYWLCSETDVGVNLSTTP